jgi:hypothetical protein
MRFLTVAALLGATLAYPGMKGSKKDHSGVFRAIIERAGERLYEEKKRIAERQGTYLAHHNLSSTYNKRSGY